MVLSVSPIPDEFILPSQMETVETGLAEPYVVSGFEISHSGQNFTINAGKLRWGPYLVTLSSNITMQRGSNRLVEYVHLRLSKNGAGEVTGVSTHHGDTISTDANDLVIGIVEGGPDIINISNLLISRHHYLVDTDGDRVLGLQAADNADTYAEIHVPEVSSSAGTIELRLKSEEATDSVNFKVVPKGGGVMYGHLIPFHYYLSNIDAAATIADDVACFVAPDDGVVTKIKVGAATDPGSGETATVRVQKNGSNITTIDLTDSTDDGVAEYDWTASSRSLSKGDKVTFDITAVAAAARGLMVFGYFYLTDVT